ncbi:UxaA family hydrolase, partial [Pseudotabrizicola sp.]|uniref:UxaA family hydrolase n=1 Tax=Pseudotabrizicola sp. TaxID=2939647 RepID=UPI00271F6FC6
MPISIRLNPDDNVDIALTDLLPGADALGVVVTARVARGHKLANRAIQTGENIRRYGQIIGAATQDIAAGAHVHVHNIAMSDHAQDYAFASEAKPLPPATEDRTFQGFRRPDGRAGTRNYLGVLTSVNCSGSVARFIAEEAEKTDWFKALGNVDGIVPIAH